MAGSSKMKDYVRNQLRYWADEFKDNMLPRDFMTRSYSKTQLMLPEINLKPHRIAAVLHLPPPLLVTIVQCSELTIAVPSWTDADKDAAHKPLLVHVKELLVQVRNLWECSSKVRRAAEERVQAALLEPDPLGSTAAMLEFARDVNDRTKLVVDKLIVQIFVGGISRVEAVLTDLNARTTDAQWQDVKYPTTCVDYSPDHLVQTRFKVVSFMLSIGITPVSSDAAGIQTIRLMTKVSVMLRVTRLYRRKEIAASWRRHMQLVDVNFGAVKLELGIAEFMEVFTVASTLCNWVWNGKSSESFTPVDGMAADRESFRLSGQQEPNIELQITFRGTIEAKLKFTSPTEGPQELFLVADRATGKIIFHSHGVCELQLSLHELAVRFRGYVVFRLKPDREVFQIEQCPSSLSVRWRVQSVLCRVDDDLAAILTEIHQFVNQKEQAIVIRCGTCQQRISLEMIDVHVCPPRNSSKSLPSTPHTGQAPLESRRNSFSEASSLEDLEKTIGGNGPPKVHIVLHLDELELQTSSRMVQILLKLFGINEAEAIVSRDVTTKLSTLRLTTESNEFTGDTIFVPALPLAFQMLECSLQGCGCVLRRKEVSDYHGTSQGIIYGYHWPSRLFLDVAHCTISTQECFVKVDQIQVRSSFSDGSRVCSSCEPQLGFHVNVGKVRCQLDDVLFQLARQVFEHIGGASLRARNSIAMTLFLGVLQIRAVEITLQNDGVAEACAKSLLKQAIVVFDNQLGYLCTQSSLDFKTILTSPAMKFVHRPTPAIRINNEPLSSLQNKTLSVPDVTHSEDVIPNGVLSKVQAIIVSEENGVAAQSLTENGPNSRRAKEIGDQRKNTATILFPVYLPELEREDACRYIQRMVRRKQLVRQQEQRFEADNYEPGVVKPIVSAMKPASIVADLEYGSDSASAALGGAPANESDTGSNTSSPASSPRKLTIPNPIMVLNPDSDLVGEIRDGINKLMSPLSRNLLPSESIRGGINKLMGPISRTLSPTGSIKRILSVDPVVPVVEVAYDNVITSDARVRELERPSPKKSREIESNTGPRIFSKGKPPTDSWTQNDTFCPKQQNVSVAKANEAKLAALPDVVRVLVQVGESRLCVPINPREKVEYLCQEIVRRYNELFTSECGSISAVSLQEKHGGVFSRMDTIGFILSVAPNELLFAYPQERAGQIRSLARLASGSSSSACSRVHQDISSSQEAEDGKRLRYSKLPLPLALALLANESERDLIRSGFCERASENTGEAWPDLALNAASLDAEKNPLVVEVVWHETCIEVTDGDTFVLCQQLLGICTSQTTSKYVGKILRGRLKVDLSNPLIVWACRRKLQKAHNDHFTQPSDHEQVLDATYEHLKKIVQDTYGMYTR